MEIFMGYIYAVIAGACMSIQGVMNTRLGEKAGLFLANSYVQGTAFLLSLIVLLFAKDSTLKAFGEVNKFYLLGGAFGIAITLTVMMSVKGTSPAIAVSTILVSQLICAAIIDAFGLMGTQKLAFGWNKYLGAVIMIAGVLIFKMKR
ncbi:MAG: DMT family transporter [Clostridia bacterium]|nr:DMT family transporter [Clostridia bacterium]MBO7289638.1 DMT family transporter [Clostridia bacterium]